MSSPSKKDESSNTMPSSQPLWEPNDPIFADPSFDVAVPSLEDYADFSNAAAYLVHETKRLLKMSNLHTIVTTAYSIYFRSRRTVQNRCFTHIAQ